MSGVATLPCEAPDQLKDWLLTGLWWPPVAPSSMLHGAPLPLLPGSSGGFLEAPVPPPNLSWERTMGEGRTS